MLCKCRACTIYDRVYEIEKLITFSLATQGEGKITEYGGIVMADKSIMEEMLTMKISNWESIKYSEGICCPNPECDNDSYYNEARNILGWCETPSGFMYVCERNKCFTKYRYHGVTGSYKFNFNKFASSFLLSVLLQKDKDGRHV